MPTKSKSKQIVAQAKTANNKNKEKAELLKQRQKEYNQYLRDVAKQKRADEKERNKEFASILKKARNTGLYNPKSNELTAYRKRRLKEIKSSYGMYLDNDKYFFLPAAPKARKKILDRAQNLQIQTSKTGLFFPRNSYKKAALIEDKKRGEYYVKRSGKVKRGEKKGKTYFDVIPLASIDELDKERERITDLASKLGNPNEGEALVFKVSENGNEGYSFQTFPNVERLLAYLDKYKKKDAARINFYRHITVEKIRKEDFTRIRPARQVKGGKYDTRRTK